MFEKKDRVYGMEYGWGSVVEKSTAFDRRIYVKFDNGEILSYTEDGKIDERRNQTLFKEEPYFTGNDLAIRESGFIDFKRIIEWAFYHHECSTVQFAIKPRREHRLVEFTTIRFNNYIVAIDPNNNKIADSSRSSWFYSTRKLADYWCRNDYIGLTGAGLCDVSVTYLNKNKAEKTFGFVVNIG